MAPGSRSPVPAGPPDRPAPHLPPFPPPAPFPAPPPYPPGGPPDGAAVAVPGTYSAEAGVPPTGWVLAGYWRRVLGWIIDFAIVGVIGLLLGSPFRRLAVGRVNFHITDTTTHVTHYYTYSLVSSLVFIVVAVLYGGLLCGSRPGQTVGMMAVGVRAVDRDSGGPIGFARGLGRAAFEYLLSIAFFVPWVLDMLFPAWDTRRQTLHDKVSRTVVVRAAPVGSRPAPQR